MFKAFKEMLTRWNDFKGKTGVADYWLATLTEFLLGTIVGIVLWIFFVVVVAASSSESASAVLVILGVIIAIAATVVYVWLLVAGLAMTVRRIRDAGFPWWFIFVNFVPTVGQIALIVFCCLPSVNEPRIDFGTSGGTNTAYTPNPAQPQNPPKPVETEVIDLEPAEDAPKADDGTWICPNCGTENSVNFCSSCGYKKP